MEINNLSVLKTFTRKLANCRYKVDLDNVISYIENGDFGYTVEAGAETVVTNDTVFASDMSSLIVHLKNIFRQPHIFLKKEEVVRNVETLSKIDNEALMMNYKDSKLWKIKDSETALEYAHAYVHEDNLAIYENRFITCLIDIIFLSISKKLNQLCEKLSTVNSVISGKNHVISLPTKNYADFLSEIDETPVLASNRNVLVNTINSLNKSRKQLQILMGRDLYQACKKARPFDILNLKETNILLHDKEYNYCYVFYTRYFDRDPVITTESKMYEGFIHINSFVALNGLGFIPDRTEENKPQEILVNNSANVKYTPLSFSKNPFTVTLSQAEDGGIDVTVTENTDSNEGKFAIKILSSAKVAKKENFDVNAYAKKLIENQASDVYQTFLITDLPTDAFNAYTVSAEKADAVETLKKILRMCVALFEGAFSVHSRLCPVCGSNFVSAVGTDYVCNICDSTYHIFNYELKDFVWVKKFPVASESDLRVGINDDEEIKEVIELSQENETEEESQSSEQENAVYEEENLSAENSDLDSETAVSDDTPAEEETTLSEESEIDETAVAIDGDNAPLSDETTDENADVNNDDSHGFGPIIDEDDEENGYDQRETFVKSFVGKMSQIKDSDKQFYSELKNYALSYKKVNSRISWNFDTFSSSRVPKFKFGIRGKTLVIYFALNPQEYADTKYFLHDESAVKKYESTPAMMKIKSERAVHFAKELIDVVLNGHDKKTSFIPSEYSFPYKTDFELVNEGQAKAVTITFKK